MAVSDYSTTPDLNTTISGINIAEGCAPSGINNAIRQLMADVKTESDTRTAQATAQATKDAEQDTAIAAAQATADAALPKTGGAMTGEVTLTNVPLSLKDNSVSLQPSSDTWMSGSVRWFDKNNKRTAFIQPMLLSSGETELRLYAANATSEKHIAFSSDGTARINNNPVLTSAGGTVDYINVGETGAVRSYLTDATREAHFGADDIYGNPGAYLNTYNVYSSYNPGGVELITRNTDGSIGPVLGMARDGGLFWNGSPIYTVVASWRDGANWYRKYSDGWIEQGGVSSNYIGANYQDITLFVPMTDTNYTALVSQSVDTNQSMSATITVGCSKISTSVVRVLGRNFPNFGETAKLNWYVCGY